MFIENKKTVYRGSGGWSGGEGRDNIYKNYYSEWNSPLFSHKALHLSLYMATGKRLIFEAFMASCIYGILVSINLSKVTIKNNRGTFIHVALISFLFTLNSYLLTCACTWFILKFLKIFIKRIKFHIGGKQVLRSSLILNKDTRVPSGFIHAFTNSILLDQIYFIEEPAYILFYNICMS